MDLVTIAYWGVLVIAGVACGFLNTLASSGSAITLPLMILLGFPEAAANATNRVPVFLGTLMATIAFARKGQLDWGAAAKFSPALIVGAVSGVVFAEHLGDRAMGLSITGAVLVTLLLLFTKTKEALFRIMTDPPHVSWKAIALMVAAGFWIGWIILDGATYLLLILMLVCSFPLAKANALKVFLLSIGTAIGIFMFWGHGEVRWAEGIVLSIGSVAGGYLGAQASNMPQAKLWAFRVVVVVIILELINLTWHYTAPYRIAP